MAFEALHRRVKCAKGIIFQSCFHSWMNDQDCNNVKCMSFSHFNCITAARIICLKILNRSVCIKTCVIQWMQYLTKNLIGYLSEKMRFENFILTNKEIRYNFYFLKLNDSKIFQIVPLSTWHATTNLTLQYTPQALFL